MPDFLAGYHTPEDIEFERNPRKQETDDQIRERLEGNLRAELDLANTAFATDELANEVRAGVTTQFAKESDEETDRRGDELIEDLDAAKTPKEFRRALRDSGISASTATWARRYWLKRRSQDAAQGQPPAEAPAPVDVEQTATVSQDVPSEPSLATQTAAVAASEEIPTDGEKGQEGRREALSQPEITDQNSLRTEEKTDSSLSDEPAAPSLVPGNVVQTSEPVAASPNEPAAAGPDVDGPTTGKQPWEMSQDEWNAGTRFYRSGKTKNAQTPTGERVIVRKESTEKTHAQTNADFYKSVRGNAVAKALQEGKTVPSEVLADYPEIAERFGKKVEPGKGTDDTITGGTPVPPFSCGIAGEGRGECGTGAEV